MTVVVSIKINDGVVLASDSATTLSDKAGTVLNVYNTANKIFNLYKGLPVAAATWGSGSIGHASISTLAKDMRARLTDGSASWRLSCDAYTIEEIADKARKFFFDEKYAGFYGTSDSSPFLGLLIAGYSTKEELPEIYELKMQNGRCTGPAPMRRREEFGINWGGDGEAIQRLLVGLGSRAADGLRAAGLDDDTVAKAMSGLRRTTEMPLCSAPMPVQDALELAEFLVRTQIELSRFRSGPQVVGGPIEVAAITKHEGFKWIKRKHFFARELNP